MWRSARRIQCLRWKEETLSGQGALIQKPLRGKPYSSRKVQLRGRGESQLQVLLCAGEHGLCFSNVWILKSGLSMFMLWYMYTCKAYLLSFILWSFERWKEVNDSHRSSQVVVCDGFWLHFSQTIPKWNRYERVSSFFGPNLGDVDSFEVLSISNNDTCSSSMIIK